MQIISGSIVELTRKVVSDLQKIVICTLIHVVVSRVKRVIVGVANAKLRVISIDSPLNEIELNGMKDQGEYVISMTREIEQIIKLFTVH